MGGLLQVTRGGALTLASQWKSQFDDSEETTDNEWKPESPEHYRGGASHAGSTHQSLMPFSVNDALGNAQTPKVSLSKAAKRTYLMNLFDVF